MNRLHRFFVGFTFLFSFFLLTTSCSSRKSSSEFQSNKSFEQGDDQNPTVLKSFPQARPSFMSLCGSKMQQSDYEELLALTSLETFDTYEDAARRSEEIAKIFARAKDRRGIFASMYVEITKESVGSSKREEYENVEKSKALVKRFAERYFEPLHNYLLNGAEGANSNNLKPVVKEWAEYYELAENCDASDLRILGTGVNCHMTFDLPYTVAEINAPESFKADFMKFGDVLVQKKRQSTNLLIEQQNVYAASFFDLFLLGKIVDSLFPDGTASTWGFQLIRAEAWRHGRKLLENDSKKFAADGISLAWNARQAFLKLMPKSNPNMKGTEE
jgi:hypothetical protein